MIKNETIFGINKNVFNLGLTSFFNDVSSDMITPLIPLFLVNILGAPIAFVGILEGIAESSSSLLKVVSGWLSDKLRIRKPLVVLGYSLSSFAKPLLAAAFFPWQVLALRFFDRTGKGIRTSPRDAIIADSSISSKMGASFGFHRAMDSAGAILGPLLAFLLIPLFNNDYRAIFLFCGIPALISVLILLFFVKETKSEEHSKTQQDGQLTLKFFVFVAIFTLFTLGNSSDAFLVLRAQNLSIPLILIPIFWLVMNLFNTISSTPAGILSDRIGRKKMLIFGLLIYCIVYFGFAFAKSSWQAWLLIAFYGLYYGLTDGVARAFIADIVPSKSRGTAYGIFNSFVGIAILPASIIMGFLWQIFGITIAFSFGGALALVSAGLLLFI